MAQSLWVDPWKEDTFAFCHHHNVSYSHRVNDEDHYNWCVVPDKGYDAVLFGAMAVVVAVLLQGKYSALWTLVAGGAIQCVAFLWNTGPLGNGIAIWLGIEPADLFLYIFLPPMLVDSAVRIDFYIFRKMLGHVLTFAFLMVIASTALMTPILLYVFDLRHTGWMWQHAALFSAMIAPTDAVSVSSVLKKGGGFDKVVVLMEGESLFNDATSIVLFEIFFEMVKRLGEGSPSMEGGLLQEGLHIILQIGWLAIGGFAIGFALGFLTKWLLSLLRSRGAKAPEEMALTVAMAYLAFYLANAPGQVSGVIAVVVYGLYGSATAKWGLSPKVAESGVFDQFWDTIGFGITGMVFFFSGVSSVNFFVRSAQELYDVEHFAIKTVAVTFWRLPVIFLVMFIVRGLLIVMFNPLFKIADAHLPAPVILFTTFGGLRGAVSLILAQMLVTQQDRLQKSGDMLQTAQMSMWTAGIVVMTLLVNAPLIPLLLKWTGLSQVSPVKAKIRAKAARAFTRYTQNAVKELKNDEDEMLRGVDWKAVEDFVDMSDSLHDFAHPDGVPSDKPEKTPTRKVAKALTAFKEMCFRVFRRQESKQDQADHGRDNCQDQLAQPLLHDEEQRASSRLEDIQEVDLEAGRGFSMQHSSRSHAHGTASAAAADRHADPLGSDSDDEDAEPPLTPHGDHTNASSSTLNTGTVISKGDMQKVMNQHQNNQFAQDVPFMGGDEQSEDAKSDSTGIFDPGNVHSQNVHHTGGTPKGQPRPSMHRQHSCITHRSLRSHRSLRPQGSRRSGAQVRDPPARQGEPKKEAEVQTGESSPQGDESKGTGELQGEGSANSGGNPNANASGQGTPLSQVAKSAFEGWNKGQPGAAKADQEAGSPAARSAFWGHAKPASSGRPEEDEQEEEQNLDDYDDTASLASIALADVTRHGHDGEQYTVVPQPIIAPRMLLPGDEEGRRKLPRMSWMNVDLHQLAQQKESTSVALPGQQPGQRAMRRSDSSSNNKNSSSRSASGRALTGHHKLDRSISGPLSLGGGGSGGGGGGGKQQAGDDFSADDLAGPTVQAQDEDGLSEEEVLSEGRIRLVAGLKRYFHSKRGRGLISAEGVQLLDHACSAAADDPKQRLNIWQNIEKDLCGGWGIAFLAHFLFLLRRYNVSRHDWRWGGLPIWIVVQWPTFKLGEVLGSILSRTMLLSIEVAVEYWLSLTWSPQAQWLSDSTHDSPLRDEIKSESKKVWKFIIDREIEAPARFQAIQSYRAAMAIMRQQANFVEQLYSSGMVDEQEQEQLLEPIEAQERKLERKGAVWRAPKIVEVLKQLPFLQNASPEIFKRLLQRGQLVKYQRGEVMWQPPSGDDGDMEGDGIYVVMAGLIKSSYQTPDDDTQEYFLGSGGVFGLLQALVGEVLPGSARCVAVGNALLQGPVVFHFPQYVVGRIKERAMEGDKAVMQLLVDLYRLAALFVVDRLKSEVVTSAITHYQHVAVLQARRHILKRIINRHKVKKPDERKSVALLWAQHKHSGAFKSIVAQEFERALTDLSAEVMQNEAESPVATKETPDEKAEGSGPTDKGPARAAASSSAARNPFKSPPPSETEQTVGASGGNETATTRPVQPPPAVPTDHDILTSLPSDTIWSNMQQHASEALGELRDGLRDALMLELGPGEAFYQESSVVLLRGKLLMTGRAETVPLQQLPESENGETAPGGQPQGPFEVSLQYSGPAVLLWLWSNAHSSEDTGLKAQSIKHTAGNTGAMLMVCPPVPVILNLDQSDQEQDELETDDSGNLDEAEETRGAWESSGEVRDQMSKQRQMMADGNLRGFWSKQGCYRLKKLKGVSGTSEIVAPSSAAQTSTSRLKVVEVTRLE
ncbi:hypothetical protein WJX77_005031 [Trebouxia sp. C0004]